MAVYFYYGEEDFNIDSEIEKMRSKLNPDFISMSYKNLTSPDFEELINILRASPMMFGSSLAVIDIQDYFFNSDEYNFDDKQIQEIENSLNNLNETIDVIFVVRIPRGEGKKIDSRRKLYKILSKFNTKEFQPFSSFKTSEISAWIKKRAKDKDLKINDDAISVLIEQIGTNLRQFDGELEKLKLAAYPENLVTKEMVINNCITNQDLFNITNFLMKGEKGKAAYEFKQLLDKKHPLEILSALQTMVRQWIIIKSKKSVNDIMKITGIRSDYRIQILKEDLKKTSLKELVKLKENLYAAEYKIKSGQSINPETEVEIAIIR